MNTFTTGDWIAMVAAAAAALVWFVRLEGRVNLVQTRQGDAVERIFEQRLNDLRHIDDKFKIIQTALERIEEKLDREITSGFNFRNIWRKSPGEGGV